MAQHFPKRGLILFCLSKWGYHPYQTVKRLEIKQWKIFLKVFSQGQVFKVLLIVVAGYMYWYCAAGRRMELKLDFQELILVHSYDALEQKMNFYISKALGRKNKWHFENGQNLKFFDFIDKFYVSSFVVWPAE